MERTSYSLPRSRMSTRCEFTGCHVRHSLSLTRHQANSRNLTTAGQSRTEFLRRRQRCPSPPALLDHRGLPLLGRVEHGILGAAHLRSLQRSGDFQTEFPAQLVGDQVAGGLELPAAPVFVESEHVAEDCWFAVPLGSLEDFHGWGS